MSEGAAKDRAGRVLGDEVADRRLDLLEAPQEVAQRVPLESVDRNSLLGLRPLPKCEGLLDEFLGLGEPADCESEHRPRRADHPELSGLSELVSDAARSLEMGLGLAYVSDLDLCDPTVNIPVHDPLLVIDPICHLAELAAEPETLRHRVGGEDGADAAVERVRERRGLPVCRARSTASLLSVSRRSRECSSRSAPARRARSLARSSTSSSASAASPSSSSGTSRSSPPARAQTVLPP